MTLPPHIRAEVQRLMDSAARRLLAEANGDPALAASRSHGGRVVLPPDARHDHPDREER